MEKFILIKHSNNEIVGTIEIENNIITSLSGIFSEIFKQGDWIGENSPARQKLLSLGNQSVYLEQL